MKKSGEFWLVNGIVHDAVHKRPLKADILVKRGKIAAIGKCTGTKVVDLNGLQVFEFFAVRKSPVGKTSKFFTIEFIGVVERF